MCVICVKKKVSKYFVLLCVHRMWKKAPKTEGMPSVGIDKIATESKTKFIRWKVHGDWVQQVTKYCKKLKINYIFNGRLNFLHVNL